MAEPTETRICRGKSASAQVEVFANCPTERKTMRERYISLKLSERKEREMWGKRNITVVIRFRVWH
jgi:hypothetical protein